MRIVGLLISIALISLLLVWWISRLLNSTDKAVTTTQQLKGGQNIQTQTGSGPIDYSKQKVNEINEKSQERSEEINQLP